MISFNKNLYNKKILNKIVRFNNLNFSSKRHNSSKIILCEFTNNKCIQASFSILSNYIRKKKGFKIVAFDTEINKSLIGRFKKRINYSLKRGLNFKIYNSFNVDNFLFYDFKKKNDCKIDNLTDKILAKLSDKKDVLDIKVNKVWIGDLIYDSYLKDYNLPTVDIKSTQFKKFLKNCLNIFFYWQEYFSNNDVKAVIVSHSVYISAFPLRIAIQMGIKVYQANFHNVYCLNKRRLFAYNLFSDYKKIFNKFSNKYKTKALNYSKKQIERRFSGEVGINMYYSTMSSFTDYKYKKRVIKKSNKTKILIASHCFLDSPHCYGKNSIFPDFYEWFDFLGKLSQKKNYEWYVKTHPNYKAETKKVVDDFVKKYPKIKLISPEISHHQIIKEGINCAITVHGTIAWEYAYFGIPVISCSKNNPHINFNFTYHANSIKKIKWAVDNINRLNLNFSKKEIYKFYFMNNVFRQSDWFLDDLDKFIHKIGGNKNLSRMKFYDSWIDEFNEKKFNRTYKLLENHLAKHNFLIPKKI